jgi:hypothetical protein
MSTSHKEVGGSTGTDPRILSIDITGRVLVGFSCNRFMITGKHSVPVRWAKGMVCRGEGEKNLFHRLAMKFRKYSMLLVTVPTELSRSLGLAF